MSSTLDHFDAPLLQLLGTLQLVDLFDGLAEIFGPELCREASGRQTA
jgi:hypothetical protein